MTNSAYPSSLVDAANAIRSGSITSFRLTQIAIEHAQILQHELNCFITLDADSALAAAEKADKAKTSGELLGPMHGVPLAHKDLFYREARICTCGSHIRRQYQPSYTSTVLSRLDSAGAIDLGTLNLSEFAAGPTGTNAHYGNCHNPCNIEYIAGGSSSGSAAATASGIVYGSFGSDTGGSVRIPAAACGVVGLLPTRGRISCYGMMPFSWSLDSPGPIARTARDCARLLAVVAGPDPCDVNTVDTPVEDYERDLAAGIEGLKIGIPTNYFLDGASAEIRSALTESLDVLRSLGATLRYVKVPDLYEINELSMILQKAEASAIHAKWLSKCQEEYSSTTRIRIDEGFHISAVDYIDALRLRAKHLSEFSDTVFSYVDVLHTPVLLSEIPKISEVDSTDTASTVGLVRSIAHATRPINYLGIPAISVPCGFSNRNLPMAFQLVGRPFSEALLLRVASAYERATRWTRSDSHSNLNTML